MNEIHYEFERKFLLKRKPNIKFDKASIIRQIYFKENDEKIRMREEIILPNTIILVKMKKIFMDFGANKEVILGHPTREEFQNMWAASSDRLIKKRFYHAIGDVEWHFDDFLNMNLCLTDVEMPTKNYPLIIPTYIDQNIIMEVTKFKEFSNRRLSKNENKYI